MLFADRRGGVFGGTEIGSAGRDWLWAISGFAGCGPIKFLCCDVPPYRPYASLMCFVGHGHYSDFVLDQ